MTFLPNETRLIVTVAIMEDDTEDPRETVTLTLTLPDNATFSSGSTTPITGTITEGISDEQANKAPNEAILSEVAVVVADQTNRAVRGRLKAAFNGGGQPPASPCEAPPPGGSSPPRRNPSKPN